MRAYSGPVTYDITFVRRPEGRTLLEALEDHNAGFDGDADPEPLRLSDDQRAVWERLVERITQEIGPVTSEEFLSSLTLWRDGPAGHITLDYYGDSVGIDIPYWYQGDAALPVITEAYRMARVVEEVTGMEGFDGQAGQPTATGDLMGAAAKLGGVSRWARENLT